MRHTQAGWLACFVLLALGVGALAQVRKEPPQVDYWQPLWMQRELWGPGTMPLGMRARVLRHYTFMQYGVQPEYQGAKPTVGSGDTVLKEGARLYAARCASCHGAQGMGGWRGSLAAAVTGAAGFHDPAADRGR